MKGSASLPVIGTLRSLSPEKFVKVAVDFNNKAPKRLTDAPKWSFGKAKNLKYTDLEARSKKHVPGPNSYGQLPKWGGKKNTNRTLDMQAKRNTFIQQLMRREKEKPGPNQYIRNVKQRAPPGAFIPKGDNVNFLCEAEYLGASNPGFAYSPDLNRFKFNSTTKWQFGEGFATTRKQIRPKRKLSDAPSPNSYNTLDSWKKTQGLVKSPSFSSLKIPSYTERAIAMHKAVPGPGAYPIQAAHKMISKRSISAR